MTISLKTLPLLLVLVLAMAPAAFAQSGGDGYIQEGPSVVDETAGNLPSGGSGTTPSAEGGGSDPTATTSSSELPFTGLDLVFIALAGGSLLLLGVGMRHVTRAHDVA